ncbi:cuticle protein 1-like [Leguminivora glycinivorella]|uniref:cuticle protein 1-like n=1 Tax=Leguminivora glycinivorella TaxID=1035111 RepID=UPI002010C2E9|nr:cuticle protein 1-like [Leguminivora glycinivorella]
MFTKVLLVCAIAAVASAIEYPKGLHPALCPNYPYCDLEVLARHTADGMPIPEWELPFAYARLPYYAVPIPIARVAPALAPLPAKTPEYPADVDPASCPNYPYCT